MPSRIFQVEAAPDDFDRNLFPERLVGALGAVYRTHAAAADLFEDAICPDRDPEQRVGRRPRAGRLERLAIFLVGIDQGLHLFPQIDVAFAGAGEVLVALGEVEPQSDVEDLFNSTPTIRLHGPTACESRGKATLSRRPNRAWQSRWTSATLRQSPRA